MAVLYADRPIRKQGLQTYREEHHRSRQCFVFCRTPSWPWARCARSATPQWDARPVATLVFQSRPAPGTQPGPAAVRGEVAAFRTRGSGWSSTSLGRSSLGSPVEATWSVVPDGTNIGQAGNIDGESNDPSNLISFLDSIHHGGASPGGANLMGRSWWQLINSSFERWTQVAGITFRYEPNDDGARSPTSVGSPGVRGDHRLGGHSIDGQTSPTVLAYNYFPNFSDMVIDTDEVFRWGNSAGNYRLFRNTIMHEVGHGLGLDHLDSDDAQFLMEPILSTAFDGPQFDDILGMHRLYGDVYEKGLGNGTYQRATDLGTLEAASSIAIGSDAGDAMVAFTDVDFISIDDNSDVDFLSFVIDSPMVVDVNLTPMGPTYMEGPQNGTQTLYDAASRGDLNLLLYDTDGVTLLGASSTPGRGVPEQIIQLFLPEAGTYFVRVGGSTNAAQMYELTVASVPEPAGLLLMAGLACLLARQRW